MIDAALFLKSIALFIFGGTHFLEWLDSSQKKIRLKKLLIPIFL